MLQFALPFAAGFAATIVMHRFTNDNELVAVSASGISYARILLPIAGLGLVLLIVMVLLTQWIIPRFWAAMETIIARDITRMVESSISKGIPVKFGDLQIHADQLIVQENPPDSDAATRLILLRVAVAELDASTRIVVDATARQAVVDIHYVEGDTILLIALADIMAFDGKVLAGGADPRLDPIVMPSAFRDDPMFMTQDQLLHMRRNPDGFGIVTEAKEELGNALRQLDMWEHIQDRIHEHGRVELSTQWGEQERRVVVFADAFSESEFRNLDGRAVAVDDHEDGRLRQITATRASVRAGVGSRRVQPTVDLILEDYRVTDPDGRGVANDRGQLPIPELTVPEILGDDPALLPYRDLLALAVGRAPAAENRAQHLQLVVGEIIDEIRSRLFKRYALSVTALLLLLLGATLAMWLRDSVPLVIYLWAFLPSLLGILAISGGEHMMRDGSAVPGAMLMWSGNGVLAVVIAAVYLRLARN